LLHSIQKRFSITSKIRVVMAEIRVYVFLVCLSDFAGGGKAQE